MGEVIRQHPKFINRWARRYLEVMAREGKEAASAWGASFYNKDDIPQIASEVKRMWNRGRKK